MARQNGHFAVGLAGTSSTESGTVVLVERLDAARNPFERLPFLRKVEPPLLRFIAVVHPVQALVEKLFEWVPAEGLRPVLQAANLKLDSARVFNGEFNEIRHEFFEVLL